MAEEKKLKHHKTQGHHTTTVRHHEDGSHTVRHDHEDGSSKEYGVADHDGMMDGLMHHTSEPDEQEMAAEGGDHGVPDDIAQKVGLAGPRPTGA